MKIKETIIKALSLGTGVAIGLILIAKVCFEMSYDTCYADYGQIYQIRTIYTQHGEDEDYPQISGAIAPGFREHVPGVEVATRWTFIFNSDKFIDQQKNVVTGECIVADSCFFDIFDTEILSGNPKEAFSKIAVAMVSESFAKKLGGVSEAVGQIIYNEEMPNFKVEIGGVFKDYPYHSSIRNDVVISMASLIKESTENWFGNDRYRGYVRLAEGTDPNLLAPAIRLMQEKNYPPEIKQMAETSGFDIHFFLAPLKGEHISSARMKNMMVILTIVAILLIMISLLNYILMSVSALVKRSKEMGVRKCYGAAGANIYGIMFKEAATDVAAALAVVAAIVLSLKSVIEDIVGVPAEALLVKGTYMTVIGVILAVFFIAALVPGYLYSKIPAGAAIRNYKENRKIWKLGLLFIQTGICALLLTLMGVISAQYNKAVNDKPGYEYDNLLWTVLTGTNRSAHQGIINDLKLLPGVVDVQVSYSLPLESSSGNNVYMLDNGQENLFNIADQYCGSEGLFEMLEIPFIEGRYPRSPTEIAVSESFVKKMMEFRDWSDGAVGKQVYITEHDEKIGAVTVSGVYKDYRINTLTNQDMRASIKFYGEVGKDHMPFMAIKVTEVTAEMMAKVEEVIQARIENKDVVVKSYKDSMREAYSSERRMRNTVIIGCLVSIIIALFGLIGYVRDESQRRSKEMAVRKINGATVKEIMEIYVVEIMKLAIPAIIMGNVGAYFAASAWLRNFSEKIALSPWFFILADVVIILLVSGCVILNSLQISRSNPVESLKNE
ncbi:MAG: FtsX-like permease family protein [Bacteroidales bacterium]|nr:FtsX-like permease family protein [Bacteroidales bacterium]